MTGAGKIGLDDDRKGLYTWLVDTRQRHSAFLLNFLIRIKRLQRGTMRTVFRIIPRQRAKSGIVAPLIYGLHSV